MADTALSKYIQQKRDREVFTDPAFDRLIEPSSEPTAPTKGFDMLEVPKYTPPSGAGGSQAKPKIGSVQKAILAQKAKNSGLTDKETDAAIAIAETQEGGARFIDANAPAGPSTTYADNMPAADVWSSIASGFHNTFVSAGAGVQQLMLGWDGSKEDVEKIRQWQKDNEVQIAKATKRMLAESGMNETKFGFGIGNAAGSVAVSIAPALALAPFGVGVIAGAAIGTAASYPMIFNSTFNSAIDAGYSPEEAATYAHMISIPISAVEFIPIAKLGRTLTTKTVAGVVEGAIEKYLPKSIRRDSAAAFASKVAKSGLSDDVLTNVYRSVNNGIKDRLLVNGGVTVANAATEGFTETIQNYIEKFGEVGYDNFRNKKKGEGFGTTMEDVTSSKQMWSALEDGMFGAIAGGGASILSIGKPLYEQGVYNTLAKYDSKGRLDEGIQKLTSALQAQVDAGKIDPIAAKQAMTSVNQVAAAYKKLGSGIDDPKIKAAMYYGVRKKDMLTEEIAMLEQKKQEIEQKMGTGEIDPDIAKFDDDQINGLIALKNKQFAFTSDWLKETASQIYANKLNSVKGEMANTETDMDNLVSDTKVIKEKQSTWRKAMGFTPQFASARVGELAKSLEDIRKEYEASSRLYGEESLKDKNLVTEFDEFESATKIIIDKGPNGIPTSSKGKFVSDGEGNYAVVLEQTDADGKTSTAYRPIPNTEYYNKRLTEIFTASKQFAPIADKILRGQKLTDEEAKIADDFDVDVQEVFQKKKQASDKKIDDFVESVVYSDDPMSQGLVDESKMEDFEKQAVMDRMSRLKIVAPSIKKFLGNGNSAALKSTITKNPQIGNVLQKLSENEAALDKFLKNNPSEKKGKKKKGPAGQPATSPQESTQSTNQEAGLNEQGVSEAPEVLSSSEEQEGDADTTRQDESETKEEDDRDLSESYEELGDDTESSLEVEKEDSVSTYEDPKNPLPIEIHIPQWVDDAILKAERNGDVSISDAKAALDYVSRLYLIWSKAKDVTNRIYAEADIDEVVNQIKKDAATLAKYLYNKQIAEEKKELKANKKRRGKDKKTLTAEEIRRASLYKADLKRQIEEYTKGVDTAQEPNVKQQIKNFGVSPEMIEPVYGIISQVFQGIKNAGLSTANSISEWVGIGKGKGDGNALSKEEFSEIEDIKLKSQEDGTFMMAPNGKPSNLNENQWLQTRTKAFKNWFGDWQNDAKGSSKIIDENGEPKVMYTGTSKDKDFSKFNVPKNGAWFTSSPEEASSYAISNDSMGDKFNQLTGRYESINVASRVIPVFLNIRRPEFFNKSVTKEQKEKLSYSDNYKKLQGVYFQDIYYKKPIGQRTDGLYYTDDKSVVVVLENPTQIKSSIGNIGSFSTENGNILFKNAQAQYRIDSGKNIVEAIKNFNGSPEATVALVHEIMHPTVVAIIDGAKEGNPAGSKHTQTIISEFNKANPKSKVTLEDLIKGNDDFKEGKTSKQYRAVQEFIAESWEKYHREGGKGFSEAFQEILEQINKAFRAVYKTITGKKLTPELRQMFDEILGKENLQANDTTTTQNDSGQAEAKGPQPAAQLGGANVQPALRATIETTDAAIEIVASDRELVEQVLSEDDTQDSKISELERVVEEINRQTDEVSGEKSSNQGGPTSVSQEQNSGASQQGSTQTSDSVQDELDAIEGRLKAAMKRFDEVYEEGRRRQEEYYRGVDERELEYASELINFAKSLEKVFNVKIEIVTERTWNSLGLREDGNGVFIGSEGKVIIKASSGTKELLIHELGHVAVASIKKSAPALYKRALESIRGTVYEEMVRNEYPNLSTDEEVLREALGWAIEDKGRAILNGENTTPEQKSLYDRIKDYIKRIFRSIAEKIGLSVSPEFNLEDMTLSQFSNEVATKILSGEKFGSIFDQTIEEYQPDPSAPDEYSLYGGHVKVAHQAPKMPSTANGAMVTPDQMYSLKEFISDLQSGKTQNLTPKLIADAIKGPFEAIINSPKNQQHKWTKLTAADLSSPFANYMYMELATGGGVQSKAGQDLLAELNDLNKKYSDWVRDSHVRVIDMSSGKPVESFSYIDHVEESKLANDKVEELKVANKGFFGKINQFFLSNYFTDLFNIETVSEFLGGQGGVLSGIHGLIRKRNTDAAIFANYAHQDIEAYKKNLEKVFGLKTADDYFQKKVSVSAFNNMDGSPTGVTMDIPLGMAADIYLNYKTQSLNAPNGNDPTHSSIYYDASVSGRGATDVRGKDVIYRGITQTIEDKEYNLLFDASQIAQLESMFGAGSTYEFMIKDAFDFYSGMAGSKSRFDMVNSVYINVKGESLRKLPVGTYAPTRAYSEGSNASHRTVGAAYDDVSFIKPRTDLPSRLQGSRDVLSAMESYNQRAQNFIRNAEAAESLLVYERRVKDKWNNKEMQSKLDWLKRYRRDLNSYEQDRIIKGIEESRLGIPFVSYRTIMSNFAKSVFAFNLANPIKQGVGYLGAYGLGIIDNKYLNKYIGFVGKSIIDSYKGYVGADEGKLVGTNISLSFDEEVELLREIGKYDEMSDIWLRLEDITSNTQGVPVQDVYSAYNSGQKGAKGAAIRQFLGEKWDTITKYGLSPMRHSDRAPILAFFLAAKDQVSDMAKAGKLLDANGNPVAFSTTVNGVETMTPEAAQLVADKVTEITYRTNNMYMSNDKTGLQRSHGFFHETIGMFSSQPQKIFNLFLKNLFKSARSNFSDRAMNKMALSTFGYSVVTSAAMTAAITVSYSIMKNGGLDDDDDPKRDFLVEMGKNIIGIAPSGGTELLMSILSMYDTRGSVDASAQNPVFEQLTKVVVGLNAFKDSFDAKTEESENRLEKKAMSSMTSGLGSMVGVPSSFIKILNSELLK